MSQPPKGTTRRGLVRREALLKEATEEFLAHGYEGASLSSILNRAGGSRTTVYTQFGDKAGLFEAAAIHSMDRLVQLTDIPDDEDRAPELVLQEFAHAYLEAIVAPDYLQHHRIITGEVCRFPDVGRQLIESFTTGLTGIITRYLQRLHDSGARVIPRPAEAAGIFIGMVKGEMHLHAVLDVNFRPSREDIAAYTARCVDIFLNGLHKP